MTTGSPRRQDFKPCPHLGSCEGSRIETSPFGRRERLSSDPLGSSGFTTGQHHHPLWAPSGHLSQQPYTTPFPKGALLPLLPDSARTFRVKSLRTINAGFSYNLLTTRCNQYLLILSPCYSGTFQAASLVPTQRSTLWRSDAPVPMVALTLQHSSPRAGVNQGEGLHFAAVLWYWYSAPHGHHNQNPLLLTPERNEISKAIRRGISKEIAPMWKINITKQIKKNILKILKMLNTGSKIPAHKGEWETVPFCGKW